MNKEIVQFVSSAPYINDLEMLICEHGRKEVAVLCSDEIKQKLQAFESEYCIPRMKEYQDYLTSLGIEFVIGDLKKAPNLW